MAKFELDPSIQGTMAFEALQTGSWLAAAGFEEPEHITALTQRYHGAFPDTRGRMAQNHSCRDVFNKFFDLYWGQVGERSEIRQDGLSVYEDGSVLESWLERQVREVFTDDSSWGYVYRAVHVFLKTDGAALADDLMVTSCFSDGTMGRYVQENAFPLGEEAYNAFIAMHDGKTRISIVFDPTPDGFRRYMCAMGRGGPVPREVCFPYGTRYSKDLFGLIGQLEPVKAATA